MAQLEPPDIKTDRQTADAKGETDSQTNTDRKTHKERDSCSQRERQGRRGGGGVASGITGCKTGEVVQLEPPDIETSRLQDFIFVL